MIQTQSLKKRIGSAQDRFLEEGGALWYSRCGFSNMFFSYIPKIGGMEMIQFGRAQIFSGMDGRNLYQPVNYKLTEPLTAEKHIHYMSQATLRKKHPQEITTDVFEDIFSSCQTCQTLMSNSVATWGLYSSDVYLGSIPPKTQDARIRQSPAEFPNRFLRVGKRPNLDLHLGLGPIFC